MRVVFRYHVPCDTEKACWRRIIPDEDPGRSQQCTFDSSISRTETLRGLGQQHQDVFWKWITKSVLDSNSKWTYSIISTFIPREICENRLSHGSACNHLLQEMWQDGKLILPFGTDFLLAVDNFTSRSINSLRCIYTLKCLFNLFFGCSW